MDKIVKMDGVYYEVENADGMNGCLIKDAVSGEFLLRHYNGDGTFVDYQIRHYDLDVLIEANSCAALYRPLPMPHRKKVEPFLDYNPETLCVEYVHPPRKIPIKGILTILACNHLIFDMAKLRYLPLPVSIIGGFVISMWYFMDHFLKGKHGSQGY